MKKKSENFELIVNGEPTIVIVESAEKDYNVFFQGRRVAKLWRVKQGRFRCKHFESKQLFGGVTRHETVIQMIYSIYKD